MGKMKDQIPEHYDDAYELGRTAGIRESANAVLKVLQASQGVNDMGMFSDGTGSEDATERAYHRGLRHAINAIDLLATGETQ
jgi:hypothetical protein